ncbi:hypothetical protein PC116_g4490 [Phytophthora cactorum]|nr:hypothetical protein PC114_g11919 [Phytophthora cactorum]KAG3024771.1 hypothetical protein PC120_g6900 [Phytophthora cactorum]KAG3170715.1 hypothetical protein C6341_g10736 [Phytophthora cactorum]KAG3200946.1 hypothetical protein PC128_g4198 [Phytophthora cactorum]KAG4057043.1 hypothetical protein PC123_g7932 [Phytophthora cactorum]
MEWTFLWIYKTTKTSRRTLNPATRTTLSYRPLRGQN